MTRKSVHNAGKGAQEQSFEMLTSYVGHSAVGKQDSGLAW